MKKAVNPLAWVKDKLSDARERKEQAAKEALFLERVEAFSTLPLHEKTELVRLLTQSHHDPSVPQYIQKVARDVEDNLRRFYHTAGKTQGEWNVAEIKDFAHALSSYFTVPVVRHTHFSHPEFTQLTWNTKLDGATLQKKYQEQQIDALLEVEDDNVVLVYAKSYVAICSVRAGIVMDPAFTISETDDELHLKEVAVRYSFSPRPLLFIDKEAPIENLMRSMWAQGTFHTMRKGTAIIDKHSGGMKLDDPEDPYKAFEKFPS